MILPNDANQCSACLAQQFDLKELLQPKGEPIPIHQCRQCRQYARTDTVYEYCDPESPQLLSICLKHIPGFIQTKSTQTKLQIVDALWVWTEPHSMRLKVRVTVRAEMVQSVQMQQRVMVDFHVQWRQCPDCNREFTSRTWQAVVQLRQKRDQGAPRKGLATLEMALKRNEEIRKHVLKIDSCRHGLDFYFLTLPQAQHFASFLHRLAPMRIKTSQKLVSTDNHNNTANIKYTLTADMVPLCRDDLILVRKECRGKLAGRIGLVTKVTSNISIVNAAPRRTPDVETMDIQADSYYKGGGDKIFPILQTAERMIRWVVLDVELIDDPTTTATTTTTTNDDATVDGDTLSVYQGRNSRVPKYAMANALVARESDMGQNDATYSCVTHLGHLIQPGDIVLGYDLEAAMTSLSLPTSSSLGVVELEEAVHSNVVLPDVVLVKKVVGGTTSNSVTNQKDNEQAAEVEEEEDTIQPAENEAIKEGTKRISKRKLRRRKKHDKKQRELEETAIRMGLVVPPVVDDSAGVDDFYGNDDGEVELDEDMAADLKEVEEELATFQQEHQQQHVDPTNDQASLED
jgi:nonsense-mediated mRNA decay protein 3